MAKEVEVDYDGTLMPNDGGIFQPAPPEEVQKEIAEERAMVKSAGPLLARIDAFLDEQIALTDSVSSIDVNADDVKSQLLAQRKLKDLLFAVKSDLENLKSAHLDKS